MKKKDTILISIIIILIISLVAIIYYYNKDKNLTTEGEVLVVGSNYLLVGTPDNEDYVIITKDNDYQVGDKLQLELTEINKNKTPHEAIAKKITKLKESNNTNKILLEENNLNNDKQASSIIDENKENENTFSSEENYTEEQIIKYFEDLNNELTTYDTNDENIVKTIKSKFVKCIDFIFYDEEIGNKTFDELTNATKIKILEIAMSIDSKIENKFPGYKDSINVTYQNIKSKVIEKYLETTTNICNSDPDLCITAKEGFQDLKDNFGLTWDLIKELASSSVSKLKDWYEIWRYN